MPSFMTTQWTPQLDTAGRVTGFSSSARGYDARPGAAVEMSDRTYRVAGDGTIRRTDPKPSGGKKARVKQRRQAAGAGGSARKAFEAGAGGDSECAGDRTLGRSRR